MPGSSPNSNDSVAPSETPSEGPEVPRPRGPIKREPEKLAWERNALLFALTVASVVYTAFNMSSAETTRGRLVEGAEFAGTLLSILLAHEFGHYFAARIHKVDASLPFFIPLPILSPFGTMGAIIRMRGRIATRRALLDIGAAGPLAGLVLAIPLYAYGVAHSTVAPIVAENGAELGESLLLKVMDRVFGAAQPPGMELQLSPIAFGAWGGFFVTMINLIPVGQLDGGHVAYALFGPRQDRFARVIHRAMLVFFAVGLARQVVLDLMVGIGLHRLGERISSALFWFVWFELLAILSTFSAETPPRAEALSNRIRAGATLGLVLMAGVGRWWEGEGHNAVPFFLAWLVGAAILVGAEARFGVLHDPSALAHPSTGDAPLGAGRKAIAVGTLLAFVLLFMPAPFSM